MWRKYAYRQYMAFTFEKQSLSGVVKVVAKEYADERGSFAELFKKSDFVQAGIEHDFVQMNYSRSQKGVVRGLHYQLSPEVQGKLVMVLSGQIFDVAVDLRRDQGTFGQWIGLDIRAENKELVYIPEGFAHGFSVLSNEAEVIYYCTAEYDPTLERGIIWNDKTLGIDWRVAKATISEKDQQLAILNEAEIHF